MKKDLIMILILIISVFILPNPLLARQFKVIRVYNGDTIKAQGNGTVIKVRLAGIDAPECGILKRELGQPYSQDSKGYLKDLILNKDVEIEHYSLKKDNLYFGAVFLEGKNVNLEMVRAGFAEAYQWKPLKGFNLDPFLIAERDAKASKKGMWIQGHSYESPRVWREKVKRRLTRFMLYGISAQKGKR